MKIESISSGNIGNTEQTQSKAGADSVKSKPKNLQSNKKSLNINQNQQNILLNTIGKLENSQQVDNTHPLSRAGYSPIENYGEAKNELNALQNPSFQQEAYGAQANLNPADVVHLFVA